jgi:hypothetical protein
VGQGAISLGLRVMNSHAQGRNPQAFGFVAL